MIKRFWRTGLIACFIFVVACQEQKKDSETIVEALGVSIDVLQEEDQSNFSNSSTTQSTGVGYFDFRVPAKMTMPGVVHIISTYKAGNTTQRNFELPELFRDFFDEDFWDKFNKPQRPGIGSGSGVIITSEGYILTNNHVINNADNIEVILSDNRSYDAIIIGTDPATDLALLKIEAQDLDFVRLGDSDKMEVGEWVMAVGNPFNLSTTVTVGIVSAKARNLNIIPDQASIESFIQTDAAVNPGNSGGALVNMEGELVGINTAIASPTGTYAGYSFAIPINIAKKVVDDLLNYGEVRRAYLGIYMRTLNSDLSESLGIDKTEGVYIDSIVTGSAAEQAGLRVKDVVVKVDDEEILATPRLQEIIGRHRPGDLVTLTILRNGTEIKLSAVLKSRVTSVAGNNLLKSTIESLGIEVTEVNAEELKKWNQQGGVRVSKISRGKFKQSTNIRTGFIITRIDKQPVHSIQDLINVLKSSEGGVLIEGFYPEKPDLSLYYALGI